MTKDKPSLTIGLPVFNGEKFLSDSIESLLGQSFSDFKLVISDNCSTDSTLEICQWYRKRDRRINVIRRQKNVGASENFIQLLQDCDSEYFMWAAADDLWDSKFIEYCISKLERNNDIQFAMSNFICTSLYSSLLDYKPKDPLDFISISETRKRVLSYAGKSFKTHKDNIVYSVWRHAFIKGVVMDIKNLIGPRGAIGGVMNDVVLMRAKGALVEDVLFKKRYRKLVPGSLLDELSSLVRRPHGKNNAYSHSEFLRDIQNVYRSLFDDPEFSQDVIRAHERAWSK